MTLIEEAFNVASSRLLTEKPTFEYKNNCLYIYGNIIECPNHDVLQIAINANLFSAIFFNGQALATRIGSFIKCKQLRIETSVGQRPKKALIGMHHKNIPESKFENYVQFINSYLFNDSIAIITDFPYDSKYKLKNNIANFLFNLAYNNVSIKGLGSDDKYWTIVKALRGHDAASVFADREGQQFLGDTSNFFRDGLFAASIFMQVPILNYAIVEKTPADEHSDIFIDMFEPPYLPLSSVEGPKQYAKWRLEHFKLITDFTLVCEQKHKSRIHQLESKKASCALAESFCRPEVYREKLYRRNLFLQSKRNECFSGLRQ